MNNFWQNLKSSFARWMAGRYGTDDLGIFTLLAGLIQIGRAHV